MDATIHYEDAGQAATARSTALRWLMTSEVLHGETIARQFGLTPTALDAVKDGAPLLVTGARAAQIDRLVATQSLLLDGYTSKRMAQWFRTPLAALDGRCASDLLETTADGTSDMLEAAEAWMA